MQTSAIENLFSYFRVQFILCKDNASCGKDKIINKVFCIGRNLYKYSSQNCEFSNKTPFVLKNAKIGHFTLFLDKSLVIRGLSRFLLFFGPFRTRFGARYFATEAPLDANGATFGLQNLSRCIPKRPKTASKSATFES